MKFPHRFWPRTTRAHQLGGLQKGAFIRVFCWILAACGPLSCSHPSPASGQPHPASALSTQSGPEQSASDQGQDHHLEAANSPPDVQLLYPPKPYVWLGVELRARARSEHGVLVERVLRGSPAEKAGLRAGDVVVSLSDHPLNSPQEVSEAVRKRAPNTTEPLLIERAGKMQLVRIQFEQMPEFEDRLRLAFVGQVAPELSGLVTFQGEVASLQELRGKVVVLEFWASFCQVCRAMGPTLDAWHHNYLSRGAHVVGITVDLPDVGLEAARRSQMGYTLGSDPDAEITRTYMASQIPTLFVIDGRGIIRDAVVGYSTERLAATQQLIERLLVEGT